MEGSGSVSFHFGRTHERLYIVALSSVFWFFIMFISRRIFPILVPQTYNKLSPKQYMWDIRFVALIHGIFISITSIFIVTDTSLWSDTIWSSNEYSLDIIAIAVGYFFWDSIVSLFYVKEFGSAFVLHGILCFCAYLFALQPFLNYYAGVFLLYELSTPFLQLHWFLEKMNLKGIWQNVQMLNGILLIVVFFIARLIMGLYNSYTFWVSFLAAYNNLPKFLFYFYTIANTILNSLNVYWFYKMIRLVIRLKNKTLSNPKQD